jgi:hypothetical protein
VSNVATVTVNSSPAALPPGITFDHITITVKDGAGASQTANVNGTETPPFTAVFNNVASGSCTADAQAFDSTGTALGSPATQNQFTMPAPVATTFPQPTSLSVSVS